MGKQIKYVIRDGRIADLKIDSEDWKRMGVEIFKIEEYQFRFILRGKQIDYFPISGKWHNIRENTWGSCPAYDFYKLFL